MSGVFSPGSRPDEWRTLGDHQRRIQALEAVLPSSQGCGVPCPPWTVDYATGEVAGTVHTDGIHTPIPLALDITDAGQILNVGGSPWFNVAFPLTSVAAVGDSSAVGGLYAKAAIDGNGSAFGAAIEISQTDGGTSEGVSVYGTDPGSGATMYGFHGDVTIGDGTVYGVFARAQSTGGSSITAGGHFTAAGGSSSDTVWGIYATASGGDSENLAAFLDGDVRIEGPTVSMANLPTSPGAAGTLYVDGSGFVKLA